MKKSLLIVLSVAGLGLALAGCNNPNEAPSVNPSNNSAPLPASSQAAAEPEKPQTHAVIYVVNPNAKGDQDALSPRTVSLADPHVPAREAVNALLQDPNSPLPSGTTLRGITIDSGLATLDFSQNPVDEAGGEGKQTEALTALARTLGGFPEINQYQIEVKGQLVKSLGEQGALDGPLAVSRPDVSRQANGLKTSAQ